MNKFDGEWFLKVLERKLGYKNLENKKWQLKKT